LSKPNTRKLNLCCGFVKGTEWPSLAGGETDHFTSRIVKISR
jgi:hypothetical protein